MGSVTQAKFYMSHEEARGRSPTKRAYAWIEDPDHSQFAGLASRFLYLENLNRWPRDGAGKVFHIDPKTLLWRPSGGALSWAHWNGDLVALKIGLALVEWENPGLEQREFPINTVFKIHCSTHIDREVYIGVTPLAPGHVIRLEDRMLRKLAPLEKLGAQMLDWD